MAGNVVVRSSVSVEVKEQARVVLDTMGLSVSDVMRIVLTHIANEGKLPFEVTPDELTRNTLQKSARDEEVHRAKDAKELFAQLGI
jgi:DNA-damage-inducible protein J